MSINSQSILSDVAVSVKNKSLADLSLNETTTSFSKVHIIPTDIDDENILVDFTRNYMDDNVAKSFMKIAETSRINDKMQALVNGEISNPTENRKVLHSACRDIFEPHTPEAVLAQEVWLNIKQYIHNDFQNKRSFKDIVVIGIGGSCLGTQFIYEALSKTNDTHGKKLHFISNIDPVNFDMVISNLADPSTSHFIIISKTFTTAETMYNANKAKNWLMKHSLDIDIHMSAVSTNVSGVSEFGISTCFGFWEWVGGRFSVWSSVGALPLSMIFGTAVFEEFCRGALVVDDQFRSGEANSSISFILSILNYFYSNYLFQNTNSQCILPYTETLSKFVNHIQQLDMESVGKTISTVSNKSVIESDTCQHTGLVCFGDIGTNSQHSFFQLLHQGSDTIPCDFIGLVTGPSVDQIGHQELMANMFAQVDALAFGKENRENPHKHFAGNRPSNVILLPRMSPFTLGWLLATYEYRTMITAVLCGDINAFDQFGVELGKVLAKDISKEIKNKDLESRNTMSPALKYFIKRL